MIPGETILSGAPSTCYDCGSKVKWEVRQSPAGYYVGTTCARKPAEGRECGDLCGFEQHSRETGYFPTEREAGTALLRLQAGDTRDARR